MIRKYSLFLLLFLQIQILNAQDKPTRFTISGYVKDAATGEALIGANVYLRETMKGVQTNTYGYYSITVDAADSITLMSSFVGYSDYMQKMHITKDVRININLRNKYIETQEVVITAKKEDQNVNSTQMGTVQLDVEQIKTLPAFMGEVDILKTIQLLPGVQSAGEGNTGFYVRGGGPDQNLILLDEALVYNASHLFGFFSVFNSDAINNVSLIKGGMPANYGGRLASVLDISLKEGNNKEFKAEGGLGPIASRLTLQGPIQKEKSSFIVSGRRTFIDLFQRPPFVKKGSNAANNTYYFYDLNAKINYQLSDKDRLFLSGYFGRDVFNFKSADTGFKFRIPWGNATAVLRWNHLFSDKLFVNTSIIFSDYNFAFSAKQESFSFNIFSGIRDYNAKIDFNWFPIITHNVKFGVNYTYHRFTPTSAEASQDSTEFDLGGVNRLY
ncbi:MAG TPA: TonB-dependent receptor, partial [Bacteroidia bacterium]|nr:TonB-dependent receptor [Bacteroidia bacterium]